MDKADKRINALDLALRGRGMGEILVVFQTRPGEYHLSGQNDNEPGMTKAEFEWLAMGYRETIVVDYVDFSEVENV